MIGKRHWAGVAAMIGLAGLCAGATVASGQDRGATPPKETIFARKILMDSIGRNMDDIEANAGSAKVDLAEGRDHADIISVMLMAFPHRLPSRTRWRSCGWPAIPATRST